MALKIYFGSLAHDLISESGRTIAEVAEVVGKTQQNQFSKWKKGRWTYIAEAKLLRLIDVIAGRDRQKRASLMIAYLIDMTPEPMRPLINISPLSGEAEAAGTLVNSPWSPSLRRKLEEIGAAYGRDEQFKTLIDVHGTWAESINQKSTSRKT